MNHLRFAALPRLPSPGRSLLLWIALAGLCWLPTPGAAQTPEAEALDAETLVRRVQDLMRGRTVHYLASMTITRPRWTRTVELRSWDDRIHDRSLVRILSPTRDRGTGFLKREKTLWTYLPRVERTIRMPPSMLRQSWMGSDFTNDDLVRDSSIVDDYVPALLQQRELGGEAALGVELLPKEEAPALWARIELWVEKRRVTPLEQIFYGEAENGDFEAMRRMRFSDVRVVQGRPVPHAWVMEVLDDPGKSTGFVIREIIFDEEMADPLFSLANLKRAEAVH